MRYAVLIERRGDGSYQASVPIVPGLMRSGLTRAATLEAIQQALAGALANTELVFVDMPGAVSAAANPWLATAGRFADDPTLETMLQEIYAERDAE